MSHVSSPFVEVAGVSARVVLEEDPDGIEGYVKVSLHVLPRWGTLDEYPYAYFVKKPPRQEENDG